MADVPYSKMSELELRDEMDKWAEHVKTAPGWASAYFAAKQCEAISAEAKRRGYFEIKNPYPIVIGS